MEYVIIAVFSYLIGSFPTAYLLLKKTKGINITENGSKNIGAFNSYEVTESKFTGFLVFIIDAAKGMLAVFTANLFFGNEFLISVTAVFFAVLGHCYIPWLKFRGGRGIATGFGGAILFAYPVLVLWVVFWIAAYLFRKNIHFANIAATILTGAIALVNNDILNKYNRVPAKEDWIFGVAVAAVMLLIMSKHIEPFKEWFFGQRRNIGGNKK